MIKIFHSYQSLMDSMNEASKIVSSKTEHDTPCTDMYITIGSGEVVSRVTSISVNRHANVASTFVVHCIKPNRR